MTDGYQALTEKEKQTLRLIVRGHDAKSTARELGLSVHTVNERLRDARRKLAVSSSREAARRLFESEGGDPQFLADKQLGDAERGSGMRSGDRRAVLHRRTWIIGGVLIMSLVLTILALNASSPVTTPPPAPSTVALDAAVAASATRSARLGWLSSIRSAGTIAGTPADSSSAGSIPARSGRTSPRRCARPWVQCSHALRSARKGSPRRPTAT